MKYIKNIKGFTLIEMLVVLVVLGSVGTIAAGVVVGTLRSTTKGNNLNNIRENGNYVVSQMSKMIAYSQEFEGVCSGTSVFCSNPVNYSVNCVSPLTSYQYLKIKSFDGGETIFSCAGTTIASNGADLIDTTSVEATSCQFYCTRNNDVITPSIKFIFGLKSHTASTFAEQNSTINFETTIQPRN